MKNHTLLLLACWFIWLQACRPKAPEPDPCAGKNPVTADFHIYEEFQTGYPKGWRTYDTDTVATGYVRFTALERNAKYEWILGTQRITEKSFYRWGFPRGKMIAVALRVTKPPDNDCFPQDSGIVTKIRRFYTIPPGCENLFSTFKGRFRGYRSDNPDKEVIMEIDPCYQPPEDRFNRTFPRIINLEPNCEHAFSSFSATYKQLYFAGGHRDCSRPVGIIRIHGKNNDSLTIKYSIEKYPLSASTERLFKTFKATRINN